MVGDKEHKYEYDVDNILLGKTRKSRLRERGVSQAPPLKKMRFPPETEP